MNNIKITTHCFETSNAESKQSLTVARTHSIKIK